MDKKYFTRKEQIVQSAIELINELGIDGLSIRELAKKENITEGAIYRHFKSKNEIIIESIGYYSHFDTNIMNTTKKNLNDSKSAIIFLFNSFAEYYENYPEITAIICSFDSLIYEPEIQNQILSLGDKRLEFLIFLIDRGKESGEINDFINSEDLADIILGSFKHLIFKWRTKNYEFSLKNKTLDMINLILKSAIL